MQGPVEADVDGGAVEAHHHSGHHEPPLVLEGPPAGHARDERTASGVRQCQVSWGPSMHVLQAAAMSSFRSRPDACRVACCACVPSRCASDAESLQLLHPMWCLPSLLHRMVVTYSVCCAQWRAVQAVDAGDIGSRQRLQRRDGSGAPACGGGMIHAASTCTREQTPGLMVRGVWRCTIARRRA